MSSLLSADILTVPEFLAHALELEMESAQRYGELADNMVVHNNPEIASLFGLLAKEGELHAAQVRQWGEEFELPQIAPWHFKWSSPEGPESAAVEDTHYLMDRRQALALALHNETRGRDFYSQVAQHSPDAEVQRLAAQMAAEEDSHVAMLKTWLSNESDGMEGQMEDLDPPNTPE